MSQSDLRDFLRPSAAGGAALDTRASRRIMASSRVGSLIAPQYVRPFVKRQKNDAADAEAIVIAAQRPGMRFAEPRSQLQQARAVLFRARERKVGGKAMAWTERVRYALTLSARLLCDQIRLRGIIPKRRRNWPFEPTDILIDAFLVAHTNDGN
jgi:hypothetical protein